MRKMTESNLWAAFAGESQAYMKYTIFAEKAEEEGYPEVARLFRAIAYAEQVHATNHLRELGGIGDTAANLKTAIGGETYEVEEMYPAFQAVAKLQGEKGATRSTFYALEAEKIHAEMYHDAEEMVLVGKDIEGRPIYICPVCGYTVIGEPPAQCPVCAAPKEKFRQF
ncbi:MAG TPA: rubrerythrin family protein [Anaerolineae bacterium]|nr:rubrerythrin family protein [Anaerolineae bacterium]HIQ05493.1 rubrerythrin family protein [Anaerolineae bacterium]